MTLVLGGLPDEEIERLAKEPLVHKADLFAKAEAWLEKHGDRMRDLYPGMQLFLNAADTTYTLGWTFKKAATNYKKHFGPAPREGRHILAVVLAPR